MAEYQRLNFSKDFYDKVSEYLKDNPEEGFEEEEVKQFMKFVLNKYMNSESSLNQFEQLEELKQQINKKLDDI